MRTLCPNSTIEPTTVASFGDPKNVHQKSGAAAQSWQAETTQGQPVI